MLLVVKIITYVINVLKRRSRCHDVQEDSFSESTDEYEENLSNIVPATIYHGFDVALRDHTPSFSEICENVEVHDMLVKHKCDSLVECNFQKNSDLYNSSRDNS